MKKLNKHIKSGLLLTGSVIVALIYFLGCNGGGSPQAKLAVAATPQTCVCNPSDQFSVIFDSIVPGDNVLISNQMDANCFAWQEFVALNWPTDNSMFGTPMNEEPVQWETYMSTSSLFLPGGATPPAWGGVSSLVKGLQLSKPARVLFQISKTDSTVVLTSTGEAAPGDKPNWLGAQNGTNLWYEVVVNYDEYQYITDPAHQFYNAQKQQDWVNAGNPIVFPGGNSSQVGAIEIKAAWMEVPNPSDARWRRYKLSRAVLMDTQTGKPRTATVALVGMHILHKMDSQPTWFWATFEHVDNLPGSPRAQPPYNFYNPNCTPKTVSVSPACAADGSSTSVTVGCTPNTPPPYYLCQGGPGPSPIQVTRLTALDAVNTIPVNDTMQAAIARYFPNSVWQNYQLINSMWSTSPYPNPVKPVTIPAKLKSMTPSTPLANSTLETYVQNLTCTDCHAYSTIAPTASDPNPTISANFSFVLGLAKYPGGATAIKKKSKQ